MRLLILGGTAFLGRAVADHALATGHDVTCLARGEAGDPPSGVRFVAADRDRPDALAPLRGDRFDAVVDVTSRPSHARQAVRELAAAIPHWGYVSTISVYADPAIPGQRADQTPLHPPAPPEVDDPAADATAYGSCKVACEQAVRDGVGPDRAFICRAGLIVGPGDNSGRFSYWVARLARGGRVLAPGSPEDPVQVVDVRDLAGWLVQAAEQRLTGVYDATSAPMPRAAVLAEVAAGVGSRPEFSWVDQRFLQAHQVRPWAGERSLPLWVPLPAYAGMLSRDTAPALAAGLRIRPVAQTAADTLDWLGRRPGPPAPEGLAADDEAALLRAWDERSGSGRA
jgi:nucleoside-diphosphate-sugar epimerase